jgi:signal transduction histidine kinase
MTRSYELWVLADEARDSGAIESCVQAAGHRVAGLVHSVTELRLCIAEHPPAPARSERGLVLLVDAAIASDADSAEALAELVRSSGLPAVQLAPELPPERSPGLESELGAGPGSRLAPELGAEPGPQAGATVTPAPVPLGIGPVTCALVPRDLALAVELASVRQELARADAERARYRAEIRQLTRALARRSAELQAVNEELEAFGFTVSHDLRAPLRAIDGFSQIILEKFTGVVDPRLAIYLQQMREASQRMSRMVGELLGLSRLMRRELRVEPCDLGAMARDILAALQQSSPERAVAVEVAPDIAVHADPTLLRAAMENLLGNAWKFTSRTPAARIEVGVTARDGQPAYFVRDNGIGFDMARAEKLFGVFQRMNGGGELEGSGMGLAKVQRIVRRHRGDIWAEAAVNRGATFTFTLSGPPVTTA